MICTVLGSTLLATAATLPSLGSGASVTVVTSARPPLVRPDVVGSLVLSITRAPSAPPIRPTTRVIAQSTGQNQPRSEEHTSELQSLMRISYAVFCVKKK